MQRCHYDNGFTKGHPGARQCQASLGMIMGILVWHSVMPCGEVSRCYMQKKNPSDRRHGPCTTHPSIPDIPAYTVRSTVRCSLTVPRVLNMACAYAETWLGGKSHLGLQSLIDHSYVPSPACLSNVSWFSNVRVNLQSSQ